MPLQSSGSISINQIRAELGSGSYSLRALSAAAGKSTPDAMSEFYGYSAVSPDTLLVLSRSSSSYPGSGSTWYDIGGNGNHGTLTNRSASNPSWSGSYFSFDPYNVYGTYQYGGYVSFPDGQFARVQSQNRVTMSCRFYPTESSYPMILCGNSYNGAIGYQGYQLWIYGGTMYARVTVGNSTTYADVSAALSYYTWTHLTMTYNGSTLTMYVNGSAAGSANISGTMNSLSPNRFLIGAQYNAQGATNTAEFYKGYISHVRLYSRVLSAAEISSNYSSDN